MHGREGKNDRMVLQTFQKATELYSSQFVCCLSTSDGKKCTAAFVQNLASGRSVYEICACCGDAESSDNTVPRLTERCVLRKVAPKNEKSKPRRRCVLCSKHGKENFSVLLPNM